MNSILVKFYTKGYVHHVKAIDYANRTMNLRLYNVNIKTSDDALELAMYSTFVQAFQEGIMLMLLAKDPRAFEKDKEWQT